MVLLAVQMTDPAIARISAALRVLLQRSLARPAVLHKRLSRVSSRGDLEQTRDEATLSPDVVSTDISNLPLSDHRHRLKTRQCSPGKMCFRRAH